MSSWRTKERLVASRRVASRRVSSACYFTVNSRLALVTPFASFEFRVPFCFDNTTYCPFYAGLPACALQQIFSSHRPIVHYCVPAHYASVLIHPVICDAMTKTNALSLPFVMYILCCRSLVQLQTIIINVGMSRRFIPRINELPSTTVRWLFPKFIYYFIILFIYFYFIISYQLNIKYEILTKDRFFI